MRDFHTFVYIVILNEIYVLIKAFQLRTRTWIRKTTKMRTSKLAWIIDGTRLVIDALNDGGMSLGMFFEYRRHSCQQS